MLSQLKDKQRATQNTLKEFEERIMTADEKVSKELDDLFCVREEVTGKVDGAMEKVEEAWNVVHETANAMGLLSARIDALDAQLRETGRKANSLELMTVVGLNSFRARSQSAERNQQAAPSTRGRSSSRGASPPRDRSSSAARREQLQAKARAASRDDQSMKRLIREAQSIAESERAPNFEGIEDDACASPFGRCQASLSPRI